jgi:hypothetical protein
MESLANNMKNCSKHREGIVQFVELYMFLDDGWLLTTTTKPEKFAVSFA